MSKPRLTEGKPHIGGDTEVGEGAAPRAPRLPGLSCKPVRPTSPSSGSFSRDDNLMMHSYLHPPPPASDSR